MLPMGGVASTSKTASDKPCAGEGCCEVSAATLSQTREALAQSRARKRHIQLKRKEAINDSAIRRELIRDRLPAMTTISQKIVTVHCPYLASFVQFGHSHNAGIGQIHRPIGVLCYQCQHRRPFLS